MKIFKATVSKFFSQRTSLGEFLLKLTKLPENDLEDAAQKGAVWIQRNAKGKILRIRSLKDQVNPQDMIQCFYDPKVLRLPTVLASECLYEDANYGVWIKPAGVVPQGSQAGDHASLLRYVEKVRKKEVYLVHRLDRETEGPMIIGYTSEAAGRLSELFQKNLIDKTYEAIVLGEMEKGSKQTINASLDDKEAVTHLEVLASKNNQSHLRITIETGRLHQIRRHLDHIGHPIMGDPKYGRGNKNKEGLKLVAVALSFRDPWLKKNQSFQHESGLTV